VIGELKVKLALAELAGFPGWLLMTVCGWTVTVTVAVVAEEALWSSCARTVKVSVPAKVPFGR
jgi:hypothetical protein